MEASVSQQMSHPDEGQHLQTGFTTADGTTPYSYDPEFQSPAVGGNGYPASFPQYSAEPPPSSFQQDSGWLGASGLGYNSEEDAWSQSDDISLVGPEESLLDENGTKQSPTQKFSRDDKLRMLALRRHLDNLDGQLLDQENIVDTTREELQKCRTSIEALTLERDHVMIQLDICQREGHSANMYRLESKLGKLAKELEAEGMLEAQIVDRLDIAELHLSQFDLDRGKYLLEEEELQKKEADLELERKGNAARRAQKESKYLSQAEQRRKIRDRDHIEALMEHDRKHREALSAAKKSQEVASQYLKQSLAKYRQEEADELVKEKAHAEKRMGTLLKLKQDINSNRDNLKALQARNRYEAKLDRKESEQVREQLIEGGENSAEVMLTKNRIDERENNKKKYKADQHQKQAQLLSHILNEEKQMRKRQKMYPHLYEDPKREKSLRVKPHKRKSPTILREMAYPEDNYQDEVDDAGEGETEGGREGAITITEKMTLDSSDEEEEDFLYGGSSGVTMAMGTVEDPIKEDLAKPEFEGLWNKQHKAYKIPKDEGQIYTLNYPSKMEKEIMAAALDKHRSGIVRKQIAAGREFKGCAFVSKPEIVHFKDFDVGKSYKKRIILTNISYSVNFLKYVDLSEHLKDFIDVQFDPPGQMSAGMSCEMLVTYKPMINEDLDGEVQFLAQTGPFCVPVKCCTKKCDLSSDVDSVNFGTQVVGETLKKTITLFNKGAKGCNYEFIKTTGLKARTVTSAGTSLGRLTTAEETLVEIEVTEPTPKKGKKGKGKKKDDEKAKARAKSKSETPVGDAVPSTSPRKEDKKDEEEKREEGEGGEMLDIVNEDDEALQDRHALSGRSKKSVVIAREYDDDDVISLDDDDDLGPGGLDGMRVGEVCGGEIGPFSSIKLEIIFAPHTPGKVDVDFELRFTDEDSETIHIKGYATAIDVPVWVERQTIDLKICMFDRLYQDAIVVNNRATTALRLLFEVQKELRNYMEILPKTAYIQAQSQFSAQLKFIPRHGLIKDAAQFFDEETGVLEVPTIIKVADQTRPVPFTISAVVTKSEFEFDVESIDFGYCTIYESVIATVKLTNTSVLSQKFGFVNLPDFIDVQPNEGFGTLLPFETIELDIIFSARKAKEYSFDLTCKSGINRDFKISCKGVGVHPPLDLSHSVVHFAATALEDNSITSLYILNTHTNANEFTHPVPRIGKGEIAPVGPTSFEFVVPKGAPIAIAPSVGTLQPGKKTCISVKFSPNLGDDEIREEAVRLVARNQEAKARKEFEEAQLAAKRNAAEAAEEEEKKGKKPAKKPAQKSAGKNKQGKGSAGLTRPKSVAPPKAEELDPMSDDYAAGKASLLRQFEGDFSSYSIPCYVASGEPGDPGTLPYDVHNTLFLEVHGPTVRPSLVVISNHGRSAVDFSEVSVGQRVIKSITIQNVSPEAVDLTSSVLDTGGPFLMLNALRSLAPDETHTILVAFEPMKANLFYEVLDVKSGEHTLGITLKGHGLLPEVKLSLADDQLDMGYVIAGEEAEETFKLENMSSFAIDYRILLDSLSYHKQLSQGELPAFIKRDTTNMVGPANYDGRSVFDCTPSDGTLQPGKKVEIRVLFRPDHASNLYSDMARVQLFGKQEAHAIRLKGVAKTKVMFMEGHDEIYPTVESLTLLPAPEEEEVVDPKAVPPAILTLLSFKALSVEKEINPSTRQLHIGCIRSTAASQKKNGEFFFDNAAALSIQGFQVEPQRGMVDAGSTKPVTFTWNPPKGHDPNLPIESSIILNLKGDVLERYNILLRALVVSE
ncbi:cilia- and flagella-associated protein 74 [Strongylocentrotus purpuratus]|uniref:Cilia- and flagella-associated protein 74 n=1 Tax=Strongylocentrotus purpuratus TaxID=7668 RepID=A0A7M7NX24_STRPU|nr:cilia- and flagella-associated protein 74 [Strongylocentrotus purpuratus]